MNYVHAGEVDVLNAKIHSRGERTFTIAVTLKHDDTGWDHYTDRWDVLDQQGNILGSRVLAHPHENEQPFTRSLTLKIPKGINVLLIRAHDSVHGLGETTFELAVPTV